MPATFVTNKDKSRIEVMLGTQLVGVIERWHPDKPRDHGAYYWITLPINGSPDVKRPAARMTTARRLILSRLAGWFDAAGPEFSHIATSLERQAEGEREAA